MYNHEDEKSRQKEILEANLRQSEQQVKLLQTSLTGISAITYEVLGERLKAGNTLVPTESRLVLTLVTLEYHRTRIVAINSELVNFLA